MAEVGKEPSGNGPESGDEFAPQKTALFAKVKDLYHLSDEAKILPSEGKIALFYDKTIRGRVGVDFSDSESPFTFFIPDASSTPDSGLNFEETLSTLRALHISARKHLNDRSWLMDEEGIFKFIKEDQDLFAHGITPISSFKGGSRSDTEICDFSYQTGDGKTIQMVARFAGKIALEDSQAEKYGHPADLVAEAIEIARLATELEDKDVLDGRVISVPAGAGLGQIVPLYEGVSNNKDIPLAMIVNKTLGSDRAQTSSGFGVTVRAEAIGNTIIDSMEYDTTNKPRRHIQYRDTARALREALQPFAAA